MSAKYESYEDLISDLDREGIADEGLEGLDDDDLALLAPVHVKKPAPAVKPKRKPKRKT